MYWCDADLTGVNNILKHKIGRDRIDLFSNSINRFMVVTDLGYVSSVTRILKENTSLSESRLKYYDKVSIRAWIINEDKNGSLSLILC